MSQRSHKYKHGRRITNPYTMIISTAIFCIWLISGNDYDDSYVQEQDVFMKPVVVEVKKEVMKVTVNKDSKATIEEKIRQHFPKNADVMVAIAKAESGLSMSAKGFNCFYNNDKTKVYRERVKGSYSTSCLVKDRVYAYSVDCFALQRNYQGTECPKGITLEQHLVEVANLSRIQGLNAWSAFNNKSYQVYLANK